MSDRLWDLITIRNEMKDVMEPQYQAFKEDFISPYRGMLKDYQANYIDPLSFDAGGVDAGPLMSKMWSMISDPSLRGYDEETKGKMYGRQADALTGAKESFEKDLSRTLAAQGLGQTGAVLRNMKEYGQTHQAGLRGAARDVELADAEAKRSDLWNAVSGYGKAADIGLQKAGLKSQFDLGKAGMGMDLLGMYGGTGEMEMANRAQQAQHYMDKGQLSQAYSQGKISKGGFWDSFKKGLGSGLGGALGGWFKAPWDRGKSQ